MARFLTNREANMGLSPGSLVFIGNRKVEEHQIELIDYDPENLTEKSLDDIAEGGPFLAGPSVTWINIDGLHDVEVIRNAGQLCKLHPLLMEDILNTGQRPKVEEFDNCIFVVLRMIEFDSESHRIVSEQLSLVLGESVLLTFQEQPGDVFEPVRERIRKQKGRVRYCGADYLAYSLLDAVVDNAISIIEKLGEGIEDLEGEILTDAAPGVMERIHAYKREMNFLSKSIRPAREMVMKIIHMENPMIREKTLPFFKDLYDLLSEATESIETYRDMLTDMMNLYNTHVNNRMNDIMKVLTVFAALFIPLTFIAGIYGTNFDYMPELRFRYGYFIFLGGLVCVAGGMIYYFKRKKWI